MALLDRKRAEAARSRLKKAREELLSVAASQLAKDPSTLGNLSVLDRMAGVREGTCSLLFGGVHGLLLELGGRELELWRKEFIGLLELGDASKALSKSLVSRRLLIRLFAAMPYYFSSSSPDTLELGDLIDRLVEVLDELGDSLAPVVGVSMERGRELVTQAFWLAVGLDQVMNPLPAVIPAASRWGSKAVWLSDPERFMESAVGSMVRSVLCTDGEGNYEKRG